MAESANYNGPGSTLKLCSRIGTNSILLNRGLAVFPRKCSQRQFASPYPVHAGITSAWQPRP
jgi:hypothetical protein